MENIQLIYRDGEPIFEQDGNARKEIVLHFGLWRADDWYFSEVSYQIGLKKSEVGWLAHLIVSFLYETEYTNEKTNVYEVVEELNDALSRHQEFDFSEHIRRWAGMDWDFKIWMPVAD